VFGPKFEIDYFLYTCVILFNRTRWQNFWRMLQNSSVLIRTKSIHGQR